MEGTKIIKHSKTDTKTPKPHESEFIYDDVMIVYCAKDFIIEMV